MAEQNGLRPLEVGIARHDRIDMFFRYCQKRLLELEDLRDNVFCFFPQVEPDVKSDLVISRPCGMQFFSCRTDLSYQFSLDIHMDIFEFLFEFEFPRLYLLRRFRSDPLQ